MGKVLILGGSNCQLNAVLKAKEKGHTAVVSDYYDDAPAKVFSDYSSLTSTFDIEGSIEVARKYLVDSVFTLGTDQPVLTAAYVSEELGLPSLIDIDTARNATNKKYMKSIFKSCNIPSVKYILLNESFKNSELADIKFPVVIKPLDSQGQRGVYRVNNIKDIRRYFPEVIVHSREEQILLEEYYESDEITVSGWVKNSQLNILTVTDRITHNNYPHIGVCTAHSFPSIYLDLRINEIEKISKHIVKSFNIKNGPVYFQMLVGADGIKVNEIACRIGGAYEDELIPLVTGVDILDMLIDASLGENIDFSALDLYNFRENRKNASVQMIFTNPGKISSMTDIEDILKLQGVRFGKYNYTPGQWVENITNATQRIGYLIIEGEDRASLNKNVETAFKNLKILNETDKSMVIDFWRVVPHNRYSVGKDSE